MGHSQEDWLIAHFTEESGPSKTPAVGLLCELFVQYQFVVDSNGRLRPPSTSGKIPGNLPGVRCHLSGGCMPITQVSFPLTASGMSLLEVEPPDHHHL